MSDRTCDWCGGPLPAHARVDIETCSKECRQARHRSRVAPADAAAGAEPMRFRYMDPPYIGLAARYYSDDERCAEVDHTRMIEEACDTNPDGWALSLSKASLRQVLLLCPPDVRVSIWVKGSRSGESFHERNAYEPVILWRGRRRKLTIGQELDDVLVWGGRQHSHPGALVGMKSAPFAEWVFRQLGALAGDYLDDAFPGSGIMMRAWLAYGGRDPNASPPQQHLGFPDVVTAPPTRDARTLSRLEEARVRSQTRLGEAAERDPSAIIKRVIAEHSSLALDDETDRNMLEEALISALTEEDIAP